MKKTLLPLSVALLLSSQLFAQAKPAAEEITRRVADHIIQTTSFQFIDTRTGEKFAATKGRDTSSSVKAESKFNKWAYVNGVLTVGMLRASEILHDPKYADYSRRNFGFIFDNLDYFKKIFDAGVTSVEYRPVFRIGSLDDFGSIAARLLGCHCID